MGKAVYNTSGNFTWAVPANVTVALVEVWGGGGGGKNPGTASPDRGGGGGGSGGYSFINQPCYFPETYNITVGAGGRGGTATVSATAGGTSTFSGVCTAAGGNPGTLSAGGTGGASLKTGSNGGAGVLVTNGGGAGGGGGSPAYGSGNTAGGNAVSRTGGVGGTGSSGSVPGGPGGAGGAGGNYRKAGVAGVFPGGGGGGGGGGSNIYAGAAGATGQVIISWVEPPVASASLSPSSIYLGQATTLDGSASTDVDGSVVRWKWYVNSTASEANLLANVVTSTTLVSFTNVHNITGASGTFNIYLVVQNNNGLWSTNVASVPLTLSNVIPVARASLSPGTIYFGQSTNLDGSASTDADGFVVRWKWYVNSTASEANVIANVVSSITSISYTAIKAITGANGVFNVYLMVQDNGGAWSVASTPITITLLNTLPVASASLSPGKIYWNQSTTLNGSASTDVGGSVVRWKWYVNSTASEANLLANVTTSTTSVSYTTVRNITGADGIFNIYLVVQDNDGDWSTNTATAPLNVTSEIPVAGVSLSPNVIYEVWYHTTTILDGSSSVGAVVRWKWYVNSTASEANVIADVVTSTATVSYTTIKAITGSGGTFNIYLMVQDNNGAWNVNTATVPLTLSVAAPVAGMSLAPSAIVWNQLATLDGSSSTGAVVRWKWFVNSPITFIDWTTPGTYSWTATTTSVMAEVWGGGGSGYGSDLTLYPTSDDGGGGGGGGGYARSIITGLTIGQHYTIVVGAGGIPDGYNYTPYVNNGLGTGGGTSYFIANDASGVSASGGGPAGVTPFDWHPIATYYPGASGVGLNGMIKYSGGQGGSGGFQGGGGGASGNYSGNGNAGQSSYGTYLTGYFPGAGGAAGPIVMGGDGGKGGSGGSSSNSYPPAPYPTVPSAYPGTRYLEWTSEPGGGGGGTGRYTSGGLNYKSNGAPGRSGKVRLSFGITGDDTWNTIADVTTSTTTIDYTTLKWKISRWSPGVDGTFNVYLMVQDINGLWSTNTAVSPITLTVAPDGPVGRISGYVWNDLNADGIWDVGEPPYAGAYVFWDHDDSGSIALGELAAITAADGSYTINNIPSGPPRMIRVVLPGPSGTWRHTYPVYGGPPYPSTYGPLYAHKVAIIPGGNVINVTFGITQQPEHPVANANGPYNATGIINTVTLNSAGSYSPSGTLTSYKWYLNYVDNPTDLNLLATGASPVLTYAELREKFGGVSGTRTLLLIVQDNLGAWSTASTTTITIGPPHASFKFVKAQQSGLYNTMISGIADLNHYAVAGWFKPSVAGNTPTLFTMGGLSNGQKDIVGLHTVGANADRLYFQTVNSTGTYTLDTSGVNFGLLDGPLATNPIHASPGWHHFYMEVRGRRISAFNPTASGRWIVVIPDGQWAYRGAWGTTAVPETDPPFPGDATHNYDFTSLGIDLLNQLQSSSGWFADVAVWGFPNINNSANTLYAPADWPAGLRVNYGQLVAGDCPSTVQMATGAQLLAFWPLVENYNDYKNHYNLTCGD